MGAMESGGQRAHVHVGSFAAGERINASSAIRGNVTAVYDGHALGNVDDRGQARTVLGTYREEFDFGDRKGRFTINFDRKVFESGSTANPGPGGSDLLYSGSVDSGSRDFIGTVSGEFLNSGGMNHFGKRIPGGLIGSLDLQGPDYSATRTMGAEVKCVRPSQC